MAIATTNIMIKSIHGRIGNLVFYYRNGVQCVRSYVVPCNPDTEAQRTVRRAFGDAVRSWQAMSADGRHAYNRKARFMNMSGYNLFISEFMKKDIKTCGDKAYLVSTKNYIPDPSSLNPLTSVSESYAKGYCVIPAYPLPEPGPG